MVHNGIEYGDMQLIAETYDLFSRGLGMTAGEISDIFAEWNRGELKSYLVEITADVLAQGDPETGGRSSTSSSTRRSRRAPASG